MQAMGERIRGIRLKQQLKLQEVAAAASVSVSFLSEIERDKGNPSISVLKRIANALKVNFTDLFGEEEKRVVVRRNERKALVHSEGSRLTWYALSQGSGHRMGPIWGVLEESASSGVVGVGHSEGDEFLMVMSGRLEFTLGNERHLLEQGDCIYYDATVPHSYRNAWKGETTLLAVTSPPTF
ncbi:helix-turn-helix domain-containing protein [Paenibacillus cymbidii]|uniref:helix-turn-helix domain-containing protein n=1 Tax=Paenibacillus cymbidii TaxID=1639034 RepID=UPI001080F8CD|nr:cupin domain-containing protein [Paenibacillus cymbidii]